MRNYYTYNDTAPNENLLFSRERTIQKNQKPSFLYVETNHLGNVHVVITDMKLAIDDGTYIGGVKQNSTPDGVVDFYQADVVSATDYYVGHAIMPGRSFNSNAYRYGGAGGQEKDDEIYGSGNAYTAEFWEYDPRIMKRWNVDPVVKPWESPYACFADNPVLYTDVNGEDAEPVKTETLEPETKETGSGNFDKKTNFYDKNDKLIKHVDDGSNAVFKQTGNDRSDEYFKFTGYDATQGGKNEVNLNTVLEFTQDYTRTNYTSVKMTGVDKNGNPTTYWQTYCNFGTRCIAKSFASGLAAMGIKLDVSTFSGSAKDIFGQLKGSSFKPLTLQEAQKAAKSGGFVAGGWSSHAFTLNKGGMINNVGAPRSTNNIWDPQYNLPETAKFYLIYTPVLNNK